MDYADLLVPLATIILEILILALSASRGILRKFPVFAAYLTFILILSIVGVAFLSDRKFYYYFYWITAPVEILLTILAELESFWRVLGSFRLLRWFRFVVPSAIVTALAYSAWQGYRFPPVEATRAGAAVIKAAVTSHYVILAVALLFFLLTYLLHVPRRVHEYRFILGFGVASLAVVFGGSVRAMFGSQFASLSQEAQPVGYAIALLIWCSAAVHRMPESALISSRPVDNLSGLKFQLRNLRSFVRRDAR